MAEPLDRLHLMQIQAALQAGYRRCKEEYGDSKPYMSMNQFYKKFGHGTGQKWIDAGLIVPVRDGDGRGKWRISVAQAEAVAITYNPEALCRVSHSQRNE